MINSKVAYQQYQKVQVETANQGSLILMLYQGCIKFLRLAKQSITSKDIPSANNYLLRSQDIISELKGTLNKELGGQIAENLDRLYDFMLDQLIQANIHKDNTRIQTVEDLMLGLLDAWRQIINDPNTKTNNG